MGHNWRIVEVASAHIQYNAWSSGLFGYPQMVNTTFANGGGDYTWEIVNSVGNFGVHAGSNQVAEGNNAGMYVFQAFLFIDTCDYGGDGEEVPNGSSLWATSDNLYFWCE
jgi:hypothetical protein